MEYSCIIDIEVDIDTLRIGTKSKVGRKGSSFAKDALGHSHLPTHILLTKAQLARRATTTAAGNPTHQGFEIPRVFQYNNDHQKMI